MAPATERVLFSASGFTTKDAAAYYRKVARWLLPHLKGVPLSIRRFPSTVLGTSFWEKDAPGFAPPWIRTISVPRKSGESDIRYVVADNVKTLAWLAETGGVELHTFLHKAPRLDRATAMVFDLDPGEGSGLADCCRVALLVRDQLEEHGLRSYPKVSGSKGLQVYVPLGGTAGHPATEAFSNQIAHELTARYPKLVVAKMAKEFRTGRVFIDWSQNSATKTTVAVYSLRAKRERPFVSMPVSWDEVETADVDALTFEPDRALARLARVGDLFKPVLTEKQQLPIPDVPAPRPRTRKGEEAAETVVGGIRLPRRRTQSGRRLFMIQHAGRKEELWLQTGDRFRRWELHATTTGEPLLTATALSNAAADDAYFRGRMPSGRSGRIEDIGSYQLIAGDYAAGSLRLHFTGTRLSGEWLLEVADGAHGAWTLAPVA